METSPLSVGFCLSREFVYLGSGTPVQDSTDRSLCNRIIGCHIVPVVGYTPGEGEDTTIEVPVEYYYKRRMTRTERRSRPRYCTQDYEWICGRKRKNCCWVEEEIEEVVVPGGVGTFTMQNQWGTGWANGGLMQYRAAVDGQSWCNVDANTVAVTITD